MASLTTTAWHRHADAVDYLLMTLGTLGAAGNGKLLYTCSFFWQTGRLLAPPSTPAAARQQR
jgi:acyl-CoA thioesterase